MKRYSVIVFVKDRGPKERIQVFLKSWSQRFTDSEILVVDSSCSAIYQKMIMGVCQKFKKVKYIRFKQSDSNWSKTAAHNLGIKKAHSKYTITTDIDAYPPPGFEDLIEPIVRRRKGRNLFYSRYKFVDQIGFKPYLEDDMETIGKAVSRQETRRRIGAKGGFQLAPSHWFKKHLYKYKIGWGGMDRELIRRCSGHCLNKHGNSKIWIYHIFHPHYKKMDKKKLLRVRRKGENSLKK